MTRINQLVLFLSKAMQNPTISKFCNTLSPLSVYSGMDPFYMLKKNPTTTKQPLPIQEITSYSTRYTYSTKMYTYSSLTGLREGKKGAESSGQRGLYYAV